MCLSCPTDCKICQNSNECDTCWSGYSKDTMNWCSIEDIDSCDPRQFLTATGDCQNCQEGCKRCEEYENCGICDYGYIRTYNLNTCTYECKKKC